MTPASATHHAEALVAIALIAAIGFCVIRLLGAA